MGGGVINRPKILPALNTFEHFSEMSFLGTNFL